MGAYMTELMNFSDISHEYQSHNDQSDMDALEALGMRLLSAVKEAEELKEKALCNIDSYSFGAMKTLPKALHSMFTVTKEFDIKIKPVVDFIDLYFEVSAKTDHSKIKKLLTEKTGTAFFIKDAPCGNSKAFIMRIHDVRSTKYLNQIINHLTHYGLNRDSVRVVEIELALDFWNTPQVILIALFKSYRFEKGTKNYRYFKSMKGTESGTFTRFNKAIKLIKDGYNIGVNDKDEPVYLHFYFKETDRGKTLPTNEHRPRFEINLKEEAILSLNSQNNSIGNLEQVINNGLRQFKFTHCKEGAHRCFLHAYQSYSHPFSQKKDSKDKHRNSLNFSSSFETNRDLNQAVNKSISNFLRNFD